MIKGLSTPLARNKTAAFLPSRHPSPDQPPPRRLASPRPKPDHRPRSGRRNSLSRKHSLRRQYPYNLIVFIPSKKTSKKIQPILTASFPSDAFALLLRTAEKGAAWALVASGNRVLALQALSQADPRTGGLSAFRCRNIGLGLYHLKKNKKGIDSFDAVL